MSKGHGYKYDWRGDMAQAIKKKSKMLNEKYESTPEFRSKLVCINLGCGFDKKTSSEDCQWINIDSSKDVKPDLVCDLDSQKLPYQNSSINGIYSRHSFEHFQFPIRVLEELYRVSKNGAIWTIIVPYGWSIQDILFHYTIGFDFESFDKFFPNSSRKYYSKVRLKPIKITAQSYGIIKLFPYFIRKFLSKYLNNIFRQITYQLEVIK